MCNKAIVNTLKRPKERGDILLGPRRPSASDGIHKWFVFFLFITLFNKYDL